MHERRSARLASCFAVSNMGMATYLDEYAYDGSGSWARDPVSDVCSVAGHLMESDEHEQIFGEEADSWHQKFKHLSVEEVREQYRHNVGKAWFDGILSVPDETLDKMRGY